ncbi:MULTISPECIES: hypothetical protein [unclassified Janthinobacterium]|uniref:hypothetical protein n=2 Tax=Janthinobacterium TaxID=29580 RepID=UPI002712F9D7|nr:MULTISPECIES: hypothetical protein [unclassified Janthinobacterium]MDO8067266.1 hypothetical protein [Janthinobacterium sp. SUN206]MDO8070281.1 hypothetical protein [Janthinobacterium sp. SUN176]
MNSSLFKCCCMALMWILLPGCVVPHFDHASYDYYYAVPLKADKPWLSLSNGLDLHAYNKCEHSEVPPKCDPPGFWVMERPQKPDWHEIGRYRVSVWHPGKLQFQPMLSAYANTTYRAVSLVKEESRKIYLLRPGFGGDERRSLEGNDAGVVAIDLRPNALCRTDEPVPRLIVFDADNIWVFAEYESDCRKDLQADFAPLDILNFEDSDQFNAILRKPMKLFYLSSSVVGQSDFGQPRTVLRDADLPNESTRKTVRLSEVVRLQSTMFRLETTPAPPLLPVPDYPNFYCHYSDTVIGLRMIFFDGEKPYPDLKYCRPFRGK